MFHRSGITQYVLFCDWLISLSMVSSRLICVVGHVRISFLFKAESYSTVWREHTFCFFIHSPINEHLGGFHLLVMVNNAATSVGVQITVQVPAFHSFSKYWMGCSKRYLHMELLKDPKSVSPHLAHLRTGCLGLLTGASPALGLTLNHVSITACSLSLPHSARPSPALLHCHRPPHALVKVP